MVASAGPSLIVIVLVVVLHDFIVGGLFSHLNPDVPSVFMLNHCFMGEQLKAGMAPSWNPLAMGGAPFAGDPQSGWFYFAPMILNALFSCDIAIRFFVILPAFVAALGVYALLRGEDVSRVAATGGGLVMGLMIAASKVLVNLPFSDSLAWTAVLLACGAKVLRSPRWSGRIFWVLVTALAWGQLAAAHLSHGFVTGTTLLAIYLVHVALGERKEGRLKWVEIAGLLALLVAAFPFVNLGHLLPIADYVDRASLGLGYDGMARVQAELRGLPAPDTEVFRALGPKWPLRFATAPGLYLGALALIAAPAAFVSARTRRVAICFASAGVLFYVLGQRVVAEALAPLIEDIPFSDFYPHSPGRFLYGVLFVAPVIAALGIEAWSDIGTKARIAIASSGVVFWIAAPLAGGAFLSRMALFGLGAVAGGLVLFGVIKWPKLVWVMPVLLAIELSGNALVGQAAGTKLAKDGLETPTETWLPLRPLPAPEIDAGRYARGGPLERPIQEDESLHRVLYVGEGLTWMFRAPVAGVETANGYNPLQLRRYWSYVRSVEDAAVRYNLSIFPSSIPPPSALDLLQVGWIVQPKDDPPPEGASRVAEDAERALYRLAESSPRFELVDDWNVAAGPGRAREAVTGAGVTFGDEVVLEEEPRFAGRKGSASASGLEFSIQSPTDITVRTQSSGPEILLVRNAWDVNWSATVDDRPADVLPANYFLQGVPVAAGEHTVRLTYSDPKIVPGAVGSGIAVLVLLLGASIAGLLEHRVQK
jgi:hypothetical protein